MQTNGFVVLHRKMLDWEWYDQPDTRLVFIHILLAANWKDKQWHGKTIKRGSLITSVAHLAKSAGVSIRECRTSLTNLRTTNEITITTTPNYTHITVNNYERYQQIDKQTTNERQTNDKRTTTTEQSNKYINTTNVVLAQPTADATKPDNRNPLIELVLSEFSKASGLSKPSDKYPRRVAQNVVQSSRSILKRYGEGDEKLGLFITRFFEWYFSQDFADKTTSIRGVYGQLDRYDRDVVKPFKGEK